MTLTRTARRLIGASSVSLLAALLTAPAALAAPAVSGVSFDVPAGPLGPALIEYARQAHRQVFYEAALVAGRTTPGLHGRFTEDDALARLLAGSSIVVDHTGPNVIVLKPPPADPVVAPADPRMANGVQVEELVVTGAQIRHVTPIAPLENVSVDQMDRRGEPTVADMLQALPQNFGGIATPASEVIGSDRVGTNDTGATGVNLRGLGATATLVLVDGHRMAGSGIQGDFADVSAIPTSAVDHVEVLLDGASSLYGSDAVGGVVNIILRRRFDGAETRFLAGGTSDGGAGEVQVGQTFGKTWDTGALTLSLEYDGRDALHGDQRPYTASADLRALGGLDERTFFSHPGNIIAPDPVTGALVPTFAIPPGQDGTHLTPGSFLPGQVNLGNQRQGADVLPEQRRYSGYASVTQQLSDRVTFDADVRFTDRDFAYKLEQAAAAFAVTNANPYFVSPNGTTSEDIAYLFADQLGGLPVTGSAVNWGATGGLTIDLGHTWQLDLSGAFAQEIDHRNQDHAVDTAFLNEALGATPDDPLTKFSTAKDGFFNPFGAGRDNSAAIMAFVDSGFVHSWDDSQVASFDAKADGTLFTLPGGPWKLAVGAQVREETFEDVLQAEESRDAPVTTATGPFSRLITAAFGELHAPLVGPNNALPGLQRLELSVSGRVEHYPQFGATANPKLGVLWSPMDGLKVRATWGTSFRAPNLTQLHEPTLIQPAFLPEGSSSLLSVVLDGGNPGLKPETATSWTAGADWTPPQVPGLTLGATWFDVHFANQIGTPVLSDIFDVLGNPTYAAFVTPIDDNNPADVAKVAALLAKSTSSSASLFPPNAYSFIVDGRVVNTGGLEVRGLDLNGDYDLRLGESDRLDVSANATLLFDYLQQVTPAAAATSLLDTAGQPVSVRARGGATWTHGAFESTLTVNYTGGYHDQATGRPVSSWTTADLQLLWRPTTIRLLDKTSVALNVVNLADSPPPLFNAPQFVGYDPANANPLGRFVSVQVIRRW
jgi:outer membrane receptor protein involved in Fe transport